MKAGLRKTFSGQRDKLIVFAGILFAALAVASYWSSDVMQKAWRKPAKASKPEHVTVSSFPALRQEHGSFRRNQTITQVLMQQGLPVELVHQIVDCARPVYDLAKIRAEKLYWLCFTRDGKFRDFRYHLDDERYLTVYHDVAEDRLVPVIKSFNYETRLEYVSAEIESSLFSAVMEIREKDQFALDLADIFGSDIDFYTDLQRGDSFHALVEKKYLDGEFSKYGAILVADFTNQQKVLTGILFEDENGKPAYFTPDGKALKQSFLKSPLKFARISSRFSLARKHPILKTVRPHLGVDYAAPLGTPVQSVAAGIVTSAGYSSGSGKMVRIRHKGGYETMYLHLSRIAVKQGAAVGQGEVIGNVGSSGLSTGPHLDFRIQYHGKAVNPAKLIFPPGAPVPAARLASFAQLRDRMMEELRAAGDDSRMAFAKTNLAK
jgi:murein DD-endopeptidase MepM/ murein hydrolase activator NlpD